MTNRLRTSNLEPDSNFEDMGVGELSVEEKYSEVKQLIAIGKEKGFLLYDEIYEVLPEEVTSLPEELDEIWSVTDRTPDTFDAEGWRIVLANSGKLTIKQPE